MKKFTKGFALVLSTVILATAGVACGGDSDKPSESETTYIRLQNYDCGYGRSYIRKTVDKFMDAVKDKEYEAGKKGVYIDITDGTAETTGEVLLSGLKNNSNDVYITNTTPAYLLNQYKSDLMDLSGILNSTTAESEFAEDTTIMSRMEPEVKNYFLNEDGTMYTVPLFYNAYLLYYDAGLVEEKSLYIQEGSTDETVVVGAKASASKGVDGVKGTDDDGLPETYTQFFSWMDLIQLRGVTPMHVSGLYQQHMTFALGQFWTDFEGYEGTKAAIDFNDREVKDLVESINADGTVNYMAPTKINPQNGYLVQKQEGRLRALEVAEKLADNSAKYYHSMSFSPSETHTGAQSTYITSSLKGQPIMMFTDGIYWETEANGVFESFAGQGSGKLDRQFKVLPTPKYSRDMISTDANNPTTSTYNVSIGQQMLVKSGITGAKLDAIKDFLVFFNSQENMAMQNAEAATPRPFTYSIDSVKDSMSTYQKSLYNVFHSDNIDIVLWASREEFAYVNQADLDLYGFLFESKYKATDNLTSYYPVKIMKEQGISAVDWFNGLSDKFTANGNSRWNELLGRLS